MGCGEVSILSDGADKNILDGTWANCLPLLLSLLLFTLDLNSTLYILVEKFDVMLVLV